MGELDQSIVGRLQQLVGSTQRRSRLPSLLVAVVDDGQVVETFAAGRADIEEGLETGPDVQYRIGSITKTVTAVAVMQLVAEGRLELADPLGVHWSGAPHPEMKIGELLTHTSGLQREPVGEVWETLRPPNRDELAENAAAASLLYPPWHWWHYSNLGYALLGELLVQMTGTSWVELVERRILGPLGMRRTSLYPMQPCAQGYAVDPYADRALPELAMDSLGIAPAAQLWSTARDLASWSQFLIAGHPDVLDQGSLELMRAPRVLADLESWRLAWGLGLMLIRSGERVYVGHTGSMPGFLAACFSSPGQNRGVVVLTNSTAGVRIGSVAVQVLDILADQPSPEPAWQPGQPVPEEVEPLLGRWWTEWNEWVFTWSTGQLVSMAADATPGSEPERYRRLGPDRYVTLNGTERGEELRIVRDPQGTVSKMYRATYPLTREPRTFGPTRT